jgi:hypothetical protein
METLSDILTAPRVSKVRWITNTYRKNWPAQWRHQEWLVVYYRLGAFDYQHITLTWISSRSCRSKLSTLYEHEFPFVDFEPASLGFIVAPPRRKFSCDLDHRYMRRS